MTEPQNWVLIGIFASLILGALSGLAVFFDRQLRLTREVILERVDGRFALLETKLDALDRDVQALTSRIFDADRK